jgi:dihydrofolate synthase/folylpolyglutamate synthase
MVRDKDITNVLKLLPTEAQYYFCNAAIPRALPSSELYDQASKVGLSGNSYESVQVALHTAKQEATTEDVIFIGGSTFVVAEVV